MPIQSREAILHGYKKRYRLNRKQAECLDGFFRKRRIMTGLSKETVIVIAEIYAKTDLAFEEVDLRLKQEHDERMAF